MGALPLILAIELLVSLTLYFLLFRVAGKRFLGVLCVVAGTIGLAAGWFSGYRISGNIAIREFVREASTAPGQTTTDGLPTQQAIEQAQRFAMSPNFSTLAHKGAAINALPPFVIVAFTLVGIYRRQIRKQESKRSESVESPP